MTCGSLFAQVVGGALAVYFFGPKEATRADVRGGVQEDQIDVKGGYSPNLIRVHQGVPLRLVFYRQENSDCSSRVLFPDFGINRSLAAFGRTTVELMPAQAGEFGFACGMKHAARDSDRGTQRRSAGASAAAFLTGARVWGHARRGRRSDAGGRRQAGR